MSKFYTIDNTKFFTIVKTRNGSFIYYFTTLLHKRKFEMLLTQNRTEVSDLLTKRYHFPIINNTLADIYLYTKCENRGFRIQTPSGGIAKCQTDIKLIGEKVTIDF